MFREWLSAAATTAGVFTGMALPRDLVLPPEPKAQAAVRKAQPAAKQDFASTLKAAD